MLDSSFRSLRDRVTKIQGTLWEIDNLIHYERYCHLHKDTILDECKQFYCTKNLCVFPVESINLLVKQIECDEENFPQAQAWREKINGKIRASRNQRKEE